MKTIDLTGKRFGRLTVIERGEDYVCWTLHPNAEPTRFTAPKWRCICDCGKEVTVLGASLRNGNTRSCGCLRKDRRKA